MSVFDLWLPILLAGLASHVLSTIAWTVLPHHKPEWNRLPIENELQDLVQKHNVAPNQFMFPFAASGAECQTEEFKQKQAKCTGMLVLWSSPLHMGKAIGFTLAFFLVAAFVMGYLGSIALKPGAPFMRVFQFMTTAALLTHCAGIFPNAFWFRRRVAMELVDGCVFAIATGLIFAALWPNSQS
ncbi:MAG: hypothetical protein ABL921_19715 [Pirellula sp.]